jgi:rubrerythrin
MPENSTLDILKSALLLEKKGKAFYQSIADKTDTPSVKEFFSFMAGEEDKHVEILSQQFKSYQANGTFVSQDPSSSHNDAELAVITKDIKDKIAAASFEAAAISAAMAMEQRAINLYADRAATTVDVDERALYKWLAEWERGHLHLLDAMDKALTEKVWYDNQFWPF